MEDTVNTTAPYIPSEDDLNVQSGSKSWRFAHGKIVQGKEIEAEVEVEGRRQMIATGRYPQEKKSVVGLLRRVGIHKNPNGKHGPEHKLEADIETARGIEHYGVSLLGSNNEFKVGIAALNFAWCLCQFQKDELMRLETAQGEPVTLPNGSKGGRPTYVNAYRVEGNNAIPLYRPKRDPLEAKKEMAEQWADLEPQIRAHPAFAERAITEENQGGPTHLTELIKDCESKGWPSPSQAPDAWLTRIAQLNGHEKKARLTDYEDHFWGEIRQAFQSITECPAWLPAAQPKQGALI